MALSLQSGCVSHCLSWRVPNSDVAFADGFCRKHEPFVRATHAISGYKEPVAVAYHIVKMAELKNPMDPSQGTTDFTLYSMVATFRGREGCEAHMAALQQWPETNGDFTTIMRRYKGTHMAFAPVVATMSNPLPNIHRDVNDNCNAFHLYFRVPNSDTDWMDQFIREHEAFVNRTHHATGDIEPRILYFAWHKIPEQNNPLDAREGVTNFTLYCQIEVYRGVEGCMKHMQVGQESPDVFSKFGKAMADYGVLPAAMAPVIKYRGTVFASNGVDLAKSPPPAPVVQPPAPVVQPPAPVVQPPAPVVQPPAPVVRAAPPPPQPPVPEPSPPPASQHTWI